MKLITDRTQYNVSRRDILSKKGWNHMTIAERREWLGNPLETPSANLVPPGPYYSSVVDLKYRSSEIVATAKTSGTYLYAVSIIGNAEQYANKVFTLSIESITASNGAVPQISVYWHDGNGFEPAGAALYSEGSVTFDTSEFPNTGNRENLALYIYVTSHVSVSSGTTVRFSGVMLNVGTTQSAYSPYSEIAQTDATKGAYNYSDLNRVERAVAEISEIAGLSLVTKTDWAMWDVPLASDMERYLGNIRSIKERYSITTSIPLTMSNLTYVDANNIEQVLMSAYEKILS